ncbi:MAG: hypothetical protein KC501_05940 [Myxococcales bacterium]|nr:hypothetical protein [Myxococcales bacterium]
MTHATIAWALCVGLATPPEPASAPAEAAAAPTMETAPAPAPTTQVDPTPAPAAAEAAAAPATEATPAPVPVPAVTPVVSITEASPPAPAPAIQPQSPVPLSPRGARLYEIQHDPDLHRQYKNADAMVISGAVVGGLGVATLLFVTLPARSLYLRSMEQAEDARWVTDLDRPLERARTREQVMWVSAAIGGGAAVLGTAVMTAGLVRRHRMLQTPASTFSMAPAVGGGQLGMTASVRF